jgi:RNA polymerase sigma factor (sigma-70 family)
MTVDRAGPWSADQLRVVAETRPRLVALAGKLARRFPVLDEAEILGIAEDRVLSDVHRFDGSRGMSLFSFSFRAIMRDVVRAAYARVDDPARAAWTAVRRYASGLEAPTLEERVNETADDKLDRARAMGMHSGLAAALAYECHIGSAPTTTPEDALLAKETRRRLSAAVASMGTEKVALMRLLYVEDSSYEEVARSLNVTVPQVKYSEKKVLDTLRQRVNT